MANEGADDGERRDVLERPATAPERQWRYGPGPDEVADAYLPAGAIGVPVVLVHGGFWRPSYDRVHLRLLAQALAAHGHPVLSLEYPRHPGDPDLSVACLTGALTTLGLPASADARDSWLPVEPPVLIGHSAGGHLVLLLAAEEGLALRGVVALAPVADLAMADARGLDEDAVPAFLGGPAAGRADLDPVRRGSPRVPVTILHGDRDSIVPPALSQSYATRFAPDVDLRLLPSTGHFELIDPLSPAFADLLAAVDRTGIE
jgi:pimeloyl-ACP methyl ester carboxylesterase